MIEVTTLAAHEEIPSGPGRQVVVLRRFEEDSPAGSAVEIVLTASLEGVQESTHPRRPDGTPMHLDEAIAAAKRVAASEGLDRIVVIDRLGGARERDIAQHDGDHSVHMERLADTDEEDGVQGSDMRDITHPSRAAE